MTKQFLVTFKVCPNFLKIGIVPIILSCNFHSFVLFWHYNIGHGFQYHFVLPLQSKNEKQQRLEQLTRTTLVSSGSNSKVHYLSLYIAVQTQRTQASLLASPGYLEWRTKCSLFEPQLQGGSDNKQFAIRATYSILSLQDNKKLFKQSLGQQCQNGTRLLYELTL